MKRLFTRYLSIIAITIFFVACSDSSESTVALTEISLSNKTAEAVVGVSKTLTVKFTPDNASNKKVTWISDNANVTVKDDGEVTALQNGVTANIAATSEDGGFTSICKITAVPRCDGINSTNNEHCKNKGTIVSSDDKIFCSVHKSQVIE